MGATAELAKFVLDTRFDDLPDAVVTVTKRILLDAVGCALGGYVTEKGKIAISFAKEEFGAEKRVSSIIGGAKTAAPLAAFVNGELINALDYDIIGPCIGHVTPFVTPPCLAVAEQTHASGKDLILALALAHEVGGRVGSSLSKMKILKSEPPYLEDAPRFSHGSSIFGGVVGAAKLFRMNQEQTLTAMGIAGWSAPVAAGMKFENLETPIVMTKYCWAGWVSQLATTAALLARRGFTADTAVLDGEWGFWKMFGSAFFKEENLLGGLGKDWRTSQTVEFKPYPVCRCNHPGIDVITRLLKENNIKPENIDRMTVLGDPLLLAPNRCGLEVNSWADAQFRNTYIFAVACYYGSKAGPFWQLPKTLDDPKVRALMNRIEVKLHPDSVNIISEKLKRGESSTIRDVIIEIKANAKTFVGKTSFARGDRLNPLSDDELKEKFRDNVSYSPLAGQSGRIQKTIHMLSTLEEVDDVSHLFELLSTG